MVNMWVVDDWVEEMATIAIEKFYPTAVAKDTGLPLQNVFERLLHLVKDGRLLLLWEIRCPNYECVRNIITTGDPSQFLNRFIECNTCGEEIEVTPDIIFPVLKVTPEYKERVLQKKTGRVALALSMSIALAKVPYR